MQHVRVYSLSKDVWLIKSKFIWNWHATTPWRASLLAHSYRFDLILEFISGVVIACMRRRIGDAADRRKIKRLLENNNPVWKQTRLTALKMAFSPDDPVSLIAESCGVGVTTVNRWIASYKDGGLDAALKRGTDRNHCPRKANEEVLSYLEEGLEAQRWNTLVEATAELARRFERRFDYKTVWTWAKQCSYKLRP